ncbi:hypothetical protein ABZT03_40610 [Streptomyces sp. NPDC005574]|uniref:hypothetical protein n=1 Tax=Streptomyces sp. NPDC005574 TaxID=3156891 RepID=UPI0033A9E203
MKRPTLSVGARIAAHHLSRAPLPAPPHLPRLRHGIRFLSLPDGTQFDGGPEREVLRGPATRTPAAASAPPDGRDPRCGLAAAVGREAALVNRVLALLHLRGLLEEGGSAPTGRPAAEALARLGATTWVNLTQGRPWTDWRPPGWPRTAPTPHLSGLADALSEGRDGNPGHGRVRAGPHDIAGEQTERLSQAYARDSVPLLPWFVEGPVSVIGPLLAFELDLSLGCLRLELGSAGNTTAPGTADPWTGIHCALACRQVLALLAYVPPASSLNGATQHDLEAWTTEQDMPTAHPSCPTCHPRLAP